MLRHLFGWNKQLSTKSYLSYLYVILNSFFLTNKQLLFKSSSLMLNDIIIPVKKSILMLHLRQKQNAWWNSQVSCHFSMHWEGIQIYRANTMIIIQMNPVLVSSAKFTKRANSRLRCVLKELFQHSHKITVSLTRLLNKGAMI